jgi:1,4-alpha-glucan branching enzyme
MTKRQSDREAAPVSRATMSDLSHLSETDIYLFNEGSHHHLYRRFGAHLTTVAGRAGTSFAVWAPNAAQVFVSGDFNDWDKTSHRLHLRESSGIWEGFIAGVVPGSRYKYHIVSDRDGYRFDKADPSAVYTETPPGTASIVWDLEYTWSDAGWMAERLRQLIESSQQRATVVPKPEEPVRERDREGGASSGCCQVASSRTTS